MNRRITVAIALVAVISAGSFAFFMAGAPADGAPLPPTDTANDLVADASTDVAAANAGPNRWEKQPEPTPEPHVTPQPIPDFVNKGIDWLVASQADNGGWGAGRHDAQHIRDPHAVKTDPGTTAFGAMALLRAGNTLKEGKYARNLSKATVYLVRVVEKADEDSERITEMTGTQPQIKLGQNIDAAMALKFFTRVLPHTEHDAALHGRVTACIDVCVNKIQDTQDENGSIKGGSWAPALQSSMANSALEEVANMGYADVDSVALDQSYRYTAGAYDAEKGARTSDAAGIELYAISSGQRATAKRAGRANRIIEEGKKDGLLFDDSKVTKENLMIMDVSEAEAEDLADAWENNDKAVEQMQQERVLSGFGNNGGEEFYSLLQSSESMVIVGGEQWESWNENMRNRMEKIQNSDGSWSGHHCITSPVFCTAAAILLLTTDQDADLLTADAQTK